MVYKNQAAGDALYSNTCKTTYSKAVVCNQLPQARCAGKLISPHDRVKHRRRGLEQIASRHRIIYANNDDRSQHAPD
jgi:hypothetical protein